MNKVYLVRHGQDTDNRDGVLNGHRDADLTTLGRKEARETAARLKSYKIDVIYSSPLKRALETAKIIAKKLNIKDVVVDQRLIERDYGILTGKAVDDILKYSKKNLFGEKEVYFLDVKDAEDYPHLYNRAKDFLNYIKVKHKKKNILVVTHGDTCRMLRAAYFRWAWRRGLKDGYFDNAEIIDLS